MKILTKEEEEAHYNETLKGGIIGGLAGAAVGLIGVTAASARYPGFRQLTLPFKTFLVTSGGTFAAIIAADKYSRAFETLHNPGGKYKDSASRTRDEVYAQMSTGEKLRHWGSENRYPLLGASWLASITIASILVGRSPYLTYTQKFAQARVYAQGLTIALFIASAAIEIGDRSEGKGRWETVKVIDPNDPEHKKLIERRIHREQYEGEDLWKDMVETEERRLKEREEAMQEQEKDIKADKVRHKKNHHHHHHHPEEKKSGTHDQDETNQNQSSK